MEDIALTGYIAMVYTFFTTTVLSIAIYRQFGVLAEGFLSSQVYFGILFCEIEGWRAIVTAEEPCLSADCSVH